MNNERLVPILGFEDFTLNDIVRMKKIGEDSLISQSLVSSYIDYLNEWIDELVSAFKSREAITFSSMNESGKYETVIVEADDENYDNYYKLQLANLKGFVDICHQLTSKVSEDEVDKMMGEIHEKVDMDKQVDDIMKDIYKKLDEEKRHKESKKEIAKNKVVSEDKSLEYELMFNEVHDIVRSMNLVLDNDGVDLDDNNIIEWTKASVSVLEKIKADLENDYKTGKGVYLSFLKKDGSIRVERAENNEIYYRSQMNYLDSLIRECKELENKINSTFQSSNENSDDKSITEEGKNSESKDDILVISDKYVLFDIVNKFIKFNNVKEIENIFKNNNPEDFWSVVSEKLDNKEMTVDEFHKIAEYLSSNYNDRSLIDDKIFSNDVYKDLIAKNPFKEEDEELNKTKVLINPSIALNALLSAIKANNKEKVLEIIGVCRYNELWNEILKRLDNKEMSREDYLTLINGLDKMVPDDDKSILMGCLDYINLVNRYPIDEAEKTEDTDKEEGKDKAKGLVNPLDIIKKRRVKSRKEKKSLIQKFKDLKTWQKALVVAGGIGAVALVGVGVYHLVPGAIAAINSFIGQNNVDSNAVQQTIGMPSVTPDVTTPIAAVTQAAPATVDFSSIGHGHQIFSDAYSAVSGNNPLVANEWFSNNPLGVFNTVTNEFLKLSSQQLHDPEVLKSLAADPNNAMLFGNSMQDADGFVKLGEIVGEVIKGGKVL